MPAQPSLSEQELLRKSIDYRRSVITMIKECGAGHMGGSLSAVDILNVLYNRVLNVSPEGFDDPHRDHYVQSKGHSVEALWAVLADKGFFPPEELKTLNKFGSHLIGHPTRKVRGVEQNTGALGHGMSFAVGLAIAGKRDARPFRVFTLLGDGELAEGSNWEAAMTAAHYKLDNLIVIVDRNQLQITGPTEEVVELEPLDEKFATFGFEVRTCDGNDIPALVKMFDSLPFAPGKPSLLLAQTRKGKGISFMENSVKWHHHVPSAEEYETATKELNAKEAALS
jgi:transketolase